MQTTDVRETAQNAVDQGRSLIGKLVDERTTQIGQQIGTVAQELRTVGDQLRGNPAGSLAVGYVEQGADLVERFGTYLEEADADRLMGDLEEFARRQPWSIAAGALVLGFAASRFLKTSSARRYREGLAGDAQLGAGAGGYGSGSYGGSTYGDTTYGDAGRSTRSRNAT